MTTLILKNPLSSTSTNDRGKKRERLRAQNQRSYHHIMEGLHLQAKKSVLNNNQTTKINQTWLATS